jgi:hypothetical protein
MLVYIYGEELLQLADAQTTIELKNEMKKILKQ